MTIESPAFRQHITGQSTERGDYSDFLTFVQPPLIRVAHRRVRPLHFEFDASDTQPQNAGASIVNVQWDFDYDGVAFRAERGEWFHRKGKGDAPVLDAQHAFPRSGVFRCRLSRPRRPWRGGRVGLARSRSTSAMQNAFLPHEDDFEVWVRGGFAPSEPATQEYLRFLADPEDERQPKPGGLWPHQWDALLRVIYAREVGRRDFWGDGLLLNIVTGGGKTALIAATMVWLRLAHHVQRFVILCPNLIVRDRLEADFRGGKVFTELGLIPPGAIVAAEDFALTTLGGSSAATSSDLFGANVVLANIHQFYRRSTTGQHESLDLPASRPDTVCGIQRRSTQHTRARVRRHATCAAGACWVPVPHRHDSDSGSG